ncbi:MAG: hypothetical protein GF411_00365 [Candidatus Lokiarchaeota archaeon]|nr:hypothetical protein [Candidatus Lokiarchaeota archaeon]
MAHIVDISEVLLSIGLGASATDEERGMVQLGLVQAEAAIRKYIGYDPTFAIRTEYYPIKDVGTNYSLRRFEASESIAYERRVSEAATSQLQLRHIPIRNTTVPRVWIDYDGRFGKRSGAFANSSEKTFGEDFWPQYDSNDDDGVSIGYDGIIRSIGLWPTEPGSVKVTYAAGYTSDEFKGAKSLVNASSIAGAVVNEAGRYAKRLLVSKKTNAGWAAGPKIQEKLGDYSYTISTEAALSLFSTMSDLLPESKELLNEFQNYGFIGGY